MRNDAQDLRGRTGPVSTAWVPGSTKPIQPAVPDEPPRLSTDNQDDKLQESFSNIVTQVDPGQTVPHMPKKQQARQEVPAATGEEAPLLPPKSSRDYDKKTLVIDLDETLVHSSFKPIDNPDMVLSVEIENNQC